MNRHSRWRFALAENLAAAYAHNPKTAVAMAAGSVGRGTADRHSDLEIDVYYTEPPSEEERRAAVRRSGADLLSLGEDEDEWAEEMSFEGFYAHTSTFLVSTMERYLDQVIAEAKLAPLAQVRISSVQHSVPIVGKSLVKAWRRRAESYPDALVEAMLSQYLDFDRLAYAGEMLSARNDLPIFYELAIETERNLMGALLGLNRIYLPAPDPLRTRADTIRAMKFKPDDLEERLLGVFQASPQRALQRLQALVDETLSLVSTHFPGLEADRRDNGNKPQRKDWDGPPSSQ